MKAVPIITTLTALSALAFTLLAADTQTEPERASKLLRAHNNQFERKVIQVSENVYTAVGFHGANTSMIDGDDGFIIVDTPRGPLSA